MKLETIDDVLSIITLTDLKDAYQRDHVKYINKLVDSITLIGQVEDKNIYEKCKEIIYNDSNVVEVDVLPNADENKDKIMLYNGDFYYAKPTEVKAVKFTALEDSTVGLTKLSSHQTLESSVDSETWVPFDLTTTISLNSGESIYIRGILSDDNAGEDYTNFNIVGKIEVSGNINTLWDYTANDLGSDFQTRPCCGRSLFYNCDINKVDELYLPSMNLSSNCYNGLFQNATLDADTKIEMLPATTLVDSCYAYMFMNNNAQRITNLKIAPILPAKQLAEYCYLSMFSYSKTYADEYKINYIKCLATDISATSCTSKLIRYAAPTGTFAKASAMNDWTIGNNGIPEGWTIINDDTIPEYKWHHAYKYEWTKVEE